jgi:hypothetical protein
VIEPRRCAGSPFAITLKATVASPCPPCDASWIQLPDGEAFHWHSRFVLTFTVPLPPVAPNVVGWAAALTGHLLVEGEVIVWVEDPQLSDQAVASTTRETRGNQRIFHRAGPEKCSGRPART